MNWYIQSAANTNKPYTCRYEGSHIFLVMGSPLNKLALINVYWTEARLVAFIPQVKLQDGYWVKPDPIPGAIFINIGDLMQRWTADVFKSNVSISPVGDLRKTIILGRN